MNTISNITIEALLSTSRFISNLESNHLRIPRRLRIFTDADVPELQLLQSAYLLALLSYAFVLNPLTELLFPFPGGRARARRVCFFVLLLAWGSLVLVRPLLFFRGWCFRSSLLVSAPFLPCFFDRLEGWDKWLTRAELAAA